MHKKALQKCNQPIRNFLLNPVRKAIRLVCSSEHGRPAGGHWIPMHTNALDTHAAVEWPHSTPNAAEHAAY